MLNNIKQFVLVKVLRKNPLTVEMTPSVRLAVAQQNIENTLGVFSRAKNELLEINKELEEIMRENDSAIDSLQAKIRAEENNRESAKSQVEANNRLAQKFEDFLS